MESPLKSIQRVSPAAFCSRDFFLLHDNAPAYKATCFFLPIYDPQKCFNTLSSPVLSRFISARLFSVPQVENEVKRTPLCGCCSDPIAATDELKRVQKEEFSAAFQKLYDRAEACIYANVAYFELKKGTCLPHVSSIKKISPETFGPHCVYGDCLINSLNDYTRHSRVAGRQTIV